MRAALALRERRTVHWLTPLLSRAMLAFGPERTALVVDPGKPLIVSEPARLTVMVLLSEQLPLSSTTSRTAPAG